MFSNKKSLDIQGFLYWRIGDSSWIIGGSSVYIRLILLTQNSYSLQQFHRDVTSPHFVRSSHLPKSAVLSRSKTNYNMSLSEIRTAIQKLEEEIDELEGLISGKSSRKVMSIIPRF